MFVMALLSFADFDTPNLAAGNACPSGAIPNIDLDLNTGWSSNFS